MIDPIPIARPVFGAEEEAAILEPLRDGWVMQGPRVARFEELVAAATGAAHAVAVTSGTVALHLALVGTGVGQGDLVAMPSLTHVATANAVVAAVATPLFVDVEPETSNLSVRDLARRVATAGPAVRAVIPVHQFGRPADLAGVLEVASEHGLVVIEDAACALGAKVDGAHVGRLGAAACYSFHPRKVITTGEGGMVTTDDPALAARLRSLRDQGASLSTSEREARGPAAQPDFSAPGHNARMTDLQGALGVVQMGRLEGFLRDRRAQAARYGRLLAEVPWLRAPAPDPGHAWQSYVCRLVPEGPGREAIVAAGRRRDQLVCTLGASGVSVRPGCHAVHALPAHRGGLDPWDLPSAWTADRVSLALPVFPGLDPADQERVVVALREAGRGN